MTCDFQELIDIDPCLSALSPFDVQVVKTRLLCLMDGGDCVVNELLEDGKCIAGLNPFFVQVLKTQLLCNMAS